MRPAYKQKIQRFLTWNRWIYGPSGENRTHGLLNPIVLLSRTQCTIRYCLDSASLNFKWIIPFCFIGCQDVSFLLWSNCGQTTLTNDLSPPAKLHRAISIFINRSCAFCLHELSIRRICQPCQWIIVVFSSLTELYDPWLLLRTGRRTLFRSSAFPRLFFRSSGFKICQPMQRPCTASCLTAWAFLLKMNGLTKKAECSSSSRLRMSRGLCVAQTTKRPDCSGNLKDLVWLNENVEGKESHVWCMWKTFRQNLQRRVSKIVIMTILVALKSLVKTR